jgi:hypothetical protein
VDDLATRLLAAIEAADDVKEDDPSGHCDELEGHHYMADEVHRRCAADRRIVARHVKVVEMWDQGDERGLFDVEICRTCAYGTSCGHCFDRDDLPLVAWPCPTLLDLAEGYGIAEEDFHG